MNRHALQLHDISTGYGNINILQHLNLEVEAGQFVVITGCENGQ